MTDPDGDRRGATHATADDDRATVPSGGGLAYVRRSHRWRQLSMVVLGLFLVAALLGTFGVRTRTVAATGGGYELTVTYASVSRPGLASPWSVEVRRAGGFDGPVRLSTDVAYLDQFDENGFSPAPDSETSDGDVVVWEFAPPAGEVLVFSMDARIEPGVQLAWRHATTAVVDERGDPVVSVRYRTVVLP